MTMTKQQRSDAAKKAAATRKRNQAKTGAHEVDRDLRNLKRAGENVAESMKDLAKTAGSAAKTATEATAQRAESELRRQTDR